VSASGWVLELIVKFSRHTDIERSWNKTTTSEAHKWSLQSAFRLQLFYWTVHAFGRLLCTSACYFRLSYNSKVKESSRSRTQSLIMFTKRCKDYLFSLELVKYVKLHSLTQVLAQACSIETPAKTGTLHFVHSTQFRLHNVLCYREWQKFTAFCCRLSHNIKY
jgi:hypothetical protein